jgi:hypothetical protein
MTKAEPKWKVGQRVLRVYRGHRASQPYWTVITKVGRKWVTVAREDRPDWIVGRFDKDTGREDSQGFSCYSDFYANAEDWQRQKHVQMRRSALKDEMNRRYDWMSQLSQETFDMIMKDLEVKEPELPKIPPTPKEK